MGEHIRCVYRSLKNYVKDLSINNISQEIHNDTYAKEFEGVITNKLEGFDFHIFCINADEYAELNGEYKKLIEKNYCIIYPAWELDILPIKFFKIFNNFSEVWAPSKFCFNAYNIENKKYNLVHQTLAVEPKINYYLSHDYFDIDPRKFNFLFSYDAKSYLGRKNPNAVIEFFSKIIYSDLNDEFSLILKINHDTTNEDINIIKKITKKFPDWCRPKIINQDLSENDYFNLINLTDCIISLHRSEGFGRLLAEALYFNKFLITTNYSGNLDFCNKLNSILVDYELVNVNSNDYPYLDSPNYRWANPDISSAFNLFVQNYNNNFNLFPKATSTFIKLNHSYYKVGLNYFNRLEELSIKINL